MIKRSMIDGPMEPELNQIKTPQASGPGAGLSKFSDMARSSQSSLEHVLP